MEDRPKVIVSRSTLEGRGLGYVPDVPKEEDYTPEHKAVAELLEQAGLKRLAADVVHAPAAPSSIDLRPYFSLVEDQGALGSCTANSAVALLEYFEKRAAGNYIDASRLFLYKTERDLLGWHGDTGAYLRTAMEALVLFGAPPERYWPYDPKPAASNTHYDVEPPAFCYAFGSNYKAITYFRLDGPGVTSTQALTNIKAYLAAGFPSIFGFPVYPEYDNPLPGWLIAYPGPGSKSRGGHANVAAGYDDNEVIGPDKGALLVRNSWGTGWGDAGYGWLSYKYVTKGLANDWWTMIKASWISTGQFNP